MPPRQKQDHKVSVKAKMLLIPFFQFSLIAKNVAIGSMNILTVRNYSFFIPENYLSDPGNTRRRIIHNLFYLAAIMIKAFLH